MNDKNLVCLNDGRRTRIDISTGRESVLDLTILSSRMAEWEVYGEDTTGSDHYPIICKLDIDVRLSLEDSHGRWIFKKAEWKSFKKTSDLYISSVQETNNDERNEIELRHSIFMAAMAAIPKSSGKLVKKAVRWWNVQCEEAVRERNRAFRN